MSEPITPITFGRPFVLRRDRDISDVSGTGIIADGVEFPDGHAVIHWRGKWPLTTPHPDGMDSIIAIHDHGGRGDLHVIWADEEAARRRGELADVAEEFEVPAAVLGTEAARVGLHRQIERALVNAATSATWAPDGRPEWGSVFGPLGNFVDAVMPVVDELLAARDRAQQVAGRAYLLADCWEAAHGSAMFLVRAAGAELREVLDNARDELDGAAGEGRTVAASGPLPPAAECSAQRRVAFEADPRECIRAAQHRGDHIDEQGYHWSDTVAVYPITDGVATRWTRLPAQPGTAADGGETECPVRLEPTLSGLVTGGPCVVKGEHQEHETAEGTKWRQILHHVPAHLRKPEPEPQHDRPTSNCSNPDHVCVKCGDCAYEHPGQGGCFVGQLPPAEGRSVRTACTGWPAKRYEELRAESLRRGKENLTKAERIRALEAAVDDLAQALRFTREYVGEELLPPIEGWSWYDALRRHAPYELPAVAAPSSPAPTEAAEPVSSPLHDLITNALGRIDFVLPIEHRRKAADEVLAAFLGPIPANTDTATWTAVRAIQVMNEAGQQRDTARATIERVRVLRDDLRGVTGARWIADALDKILDGTGCPHGHQDSTGGNQPWHVWVGLARDGDGQPVTTHVARSAGAHVAEAAAISSEQTAEQHRTALSEALGLGNGAPWAAIRDRAAELHAVAQRAAADDTELRRIRRDSLARAEQAKAALARWKGELQQALGMDPTRDWDDIRNAAAGTRKAERAAQAALEQVCGVAAAWEQMPADRYVYIREAARTVRAALDGTSQDRTDCPHCPDGHQDPTGGSQPWSVWVGPARDGDGQPTTIHVARSAGAHVAESDAEWMRHMLNHQPDPETRCRLPHEMET